MKRDFQQIEWDERLADDCRQIVRLAVREDLDRSFDLTTVALVPPEATGAADFVSREAGIIAGLPALKLALDEMEISVEWSAVAQDGGALQPGDCVAGIRGAARDLLTAERLLLNLLGRLSGIATLTQRFVAAIEGTEASIYDTRKTTPGWRRLEKYAVRCGGGRNHRHGLYDAVLIKDNHLAYSRQSQRSLPVAVKQGQEFAAQLPRGDGGSPPLVEVEVDTLAQLDEVLVAEPDVVLLDNMTVEQLAAAVAARNHLGVATELEASGGITMANIREVAQSGVERISVGALTHSAICLDIGMDWLD